MAIRGRGRICLVPSGKPTVETTADWTMGQVDYVPRRTHHNPFASSITATPLRDNTRYGSHISLYFRIFYFRFFTIYDYLFCFFPGNLWRIFCRFFFCLSLPFLHLRQSSIVIFPFSPVLTLTESNTGTTNILPSPDLPV